MPSARQLQSELNSRMVQLQRLQEKLKLLRDKHASMADVSMKFQLDYEIEATGSEASQLDNEIQGLESQLAIANSQLQLAGAANLGEWIFVTCDRGTQETDFRIHFSENASLRPGIPQLYIIQGDERQCHRSLVKRLLATSIQEYADHLPLVGKGKAAVAFWDIVLPSQDDLLEREKRLLFSLFDKCSPSYKWKSTKVFTSAAFQAEIESSLHPVIVIQHDINIPTWDKTGRDLMQCYFRFLNDLKIKDGVPQLVVFLNIIYPAKSNPHPFSPKRLLSLIYKSRLGNSYEQELQDIFQLQKSGPTDLARRDHPTCVLLKELGCVTRDDVMQWFRWNDIDEGTMDWEERCASIIKADECKTMAEIEGALKRVLKELRQGREETERKKGRF